MITIKPESLSDNLPELKPILPIHWEELALNQDKVPLDPMYEAYEEMEKADQVIFMAMRDDGDLIGYFIGFIMPGLHYRTCMTCTMDIFYVRQEHRGSGGGFMLFRALEEELKRRGVQRLVVGSKMHKDASWLFNRLGYNPIETFYSTWLGG